MNWLQLLSHKRIGDKTNKIVSKDDIRSAFERDYDRIIFSYPFRRLQDKTQVFPLPEHDFVHTRLTHSLEVSSVGRSLGKRVGKVIVDRYVELQREAFTQFDFGSIVAAASLAHDLGNPPFGHSGEDAISDFFLNNPAGRFFKDKVTAAEWADLTAFEGNALGFRILNKGLNLTIATLASFSKYPRESYIGDIDRKRASQKKFGFFQSEKEIFKQVAEEVGLIHVESKSELIWSRHPLAFLVEAADDICYNIIDLEDGCTLGLVTFEQTKDFLSRILEEDFKPEKLDRITTTKEKLAVLRALTIGKLIDQAAEVFIDNEEDILSGDFDIALTDLVKSKNVLDDIKTISVEKIYRARPVLEIEAAGFEVLGGLLEAFTTAVYEYSITKGNCSKKYINKIRLLPEEVQLLVKTEGVEIYQLLIAVTDFVASMTDSFAVSLYKKIKGISLPS